ncbi:MAG: histidinol-phosphatase [Candidatus Hydrogenedentes bacterium]|nr:histidinol-phosphatase [Candidatus Hydrogenedentota bacterium]
MHNHMRRPWKVSLHGGHSGEFCDHAKGTLREVIEAAIACGYHTFGVSEHAPRLGERYLYPTERDMGWDVAKIATDFDAYGRSIGVLAEEYADRITILRGFEIEVVPGDRYVEIMSNYRRQYEFEYIVGSVHYLHDISIDSSQEEYVSAMEIAGGLEALTIEYYEAVTSMIKALKPEVVGHLDLMRKNAGPHGPVDTPPIRRAALRALEAAREFGGILDLNTAGYRKGLGTPYPAPWLVREANRMGVPFCIGDDSHGPDDVGAGLDAARAYLLENGVNSVTVLTKEDGELVRKTVPL